jgi:sensor histidine kinase YesM
MLINFKKYWYNASIRKKLLLFLGAVILCISTFSIQLLIITYSYINNFGGSINEYFKINMLQQNNVRNEQFITKYFDDLQMDNLAAFNQSVDSFYATLQEINNNSHSLEAYLLIRSIQNSFDSYSEESSAAIRMQRDGNKDFTTHYYKAYRINHYIDSYLSQLLELSLREGNTVYDHMVRDAKVIILVYALFILLFLLLCLVLIFALSNYLTKPIEHLAKLSLQMSEGKLNIETMAVPSHDEVGTLTQAFNVMSSSIRKLVTDLQAKSVIEARLHREEIKNVKNRELLKEARFLALQSQINPHFLFNTLNTVSRVVTLDRSADAIKLINSLAGILRYTMGDNKAHATLQEELEIIEQYVQIQQYRFGDRLKVDIDCKGIETGMVTIPRFTLQPIIENSIIHGLEPKVEGGHLRIKAYIDKNNLIIKIIDNGVGIHKGKIKFILQRKSKEKAGGIKSIGLSNVINRLISFCGQKDCFTIKSKQGLGTIVIIKVPIKPIKR